MKTTFTTIIALTVLSGIALGQTKVGQLYYQITGENTASVVPELSSFQRYNEENRPTGNIIIPQTVEIEGKTYTVTSIGERAFYNCSGLTSINIPNSVTSIGQNAFTLCLGLTSVNIPNSVTTIGNNAFYHCWGLTSINIPNSVTNIGEGAFALCSGLTSIDIPNSVTSIGNYAFIRCSKLTSVNIPSSVTSIGNYAFSDCSGLTSINVDATNTTYTLQDGVLYSKDKTTLHTCPAGKTGGFIIPNHVTNIGKGAFSGCSKLTSINIPNTITSIGEWAFSDCSGLTSINIPNSVKSIGVYAFSYCSGLTSINVDAANPAYTSQDGGLYSKDKTTLHTCPAGKTGGFIIPNHVTNIGKGAFSYCSGLTSVNIPNSVTNIGVEAYSDCSSLKEVTVHWTTPLSVSDNIFVFTPINNAILRVPAGTVEQYRQADVWKDFGSIVEATSSILSAVGDKDAITEIYNLRGERLSANSIDALPRGIYIVKKGGKAIKVVKP